MGTSYLELHPDHPDCYNVLICGDFNSRIGNQKDYVIFDNDANIDILSLDYEIDTLIPRFSQDNTRNTNGRKLLDFCRQNGLRVGNGRVGADKGVGKYTYVGSTGCSVIDYVIVNSSLLDVFSTFHVGDPNILTDQCMLEFSFYVQILMARLIQRKRYSLNRPVRNIFGMMSEGGGGGGEGVVVFFQFG